VRELEDRTYRVKDVMEATHKLDLRGEVCPYTFVKTKLALEEMAPGEVLQVTVDYAPAVENVPRSVRNRGHQVLEVQQMTDSDWTITVRKGDAE
jgi:tRNA 2-thiouridine synthesizing protein A